MRDLHSEQCRLIQVANIAKIPDLSGSAPFYIAAHNSITALDLIPPTGYLGDTAQDLRGRSYDLFRWKPEEPFVFPPWIIICGEGHDCETVILEEGEPVNLCSDDRFPESPGFELDEERCYWKLVGGKGSFLVRSADLSHMAGAHLFYTWRKWNSAYQMSVTISAPGQSTKVLRQYPRESALELRQLGMRTEVIDVSDFDLTSDVELTFSVWGGPEDPALSEDFRIGDVVFVGWYVE